MSKGTCALYARVSSDAQDVDLSISAQLKALRRHAAKEGWRIVHEYIDEAKSARTDKRPAFKEMVAAALDGRFSRILVWKFSRFARNRRDSIVYKSMLRRSGVDVISINERVDDSPEGQLLEGMIEIIDQFYSDNMAGDIRRGMREALERGFYVGGPVADGYMPVEVIDGPKTRKRLVPDPQRAHIIAGIFSRYLAGQPVIDIVDDLNQQEIKTQLDRTWDTKAVYRVLRKPTYAGVYILNGEVINEDYCIPIVDRATFDAAQEKLDSHLPGHLIGPRSANSSYLLPGLLRCSLCGNPMKGEKARGHGGVYRYYLCSGRSKRRVCQAPRIPKDLIEEAILGRILTHILSEDNVTRLVELLNDSVKETIQYRKRQLAALRRERTVAKKALKNLYHHCEESAQMEAGLGERVAERKEQVAKLDDREAELILNLERLRVQELPDEKTVRRAARGLRRRLKTDDFLKQRGFLHKLVQRIEINPCTGETKIFYTFPIPKLRSYWEEIRLGDGASEYAGSPKKGLVAPRGFEPRSDG